MITQEFDLNLIPNQEPVVVHVSQYDVGEGRLVAHLYDQDTVYTPPAGATATIQGTKPDKFGFQYDATLSGNTVTADLTEQMTAVAGQVITNIIVYEGDERIGTFNFFLDVQRAALNDDTVISGPDGSLYDIPRLVTRAETAAENAERSAQEVAGESENAEAWANGKRGGEDVPSTDPAYHNNSKYYSEQSGNYTQDAEAWAVGERGGVPVVAPDETYENNSKYYAEESAAHEAHAAEIVNDANYLVGVNPATISNPQTPYLRPSDVIDNLTSTATDKPLSANQGRILNDLISAGGWTIITRKYEAYNSSALTTQGVNIGANSSGKVYVQIPRDTKQVVILRLPDAQKSSAAEVVGNFLLGRTVDYYNGVTELNLYNVGSYDTVNYVYLVCAEKEI